MTREEKLQIINEANQVLFDNYDFTINAMQPDYIINIEMAVILKAAIRMVKMLEKQTI